MTVGVHGHQDRAVTESLLHNFCASPCPARSGGLIHRRPSAGGTHRGCECADDIFVEHCTIAARQASIWSAIRSIILGYTSNADSQQRRPIPKR
jgi:hypothetical protein